MPPDRTSFEHDSCHGDGCNAYLEGKLGAMLITSKTTLGREGRRMFASSVLTLSCLFYPPPTHFHQTISLSNAEVKVCISYRSSWNRQGLCEMNIIVLRARALPGWLYLSLHSTATLSPLSFPLLPPLAKRFSELSGARLGHQGGVGRGQLEKCNQFTENHCIYCGFTLMREESASVCIIISRDREGGNKKHKDLRILPTFQDTVRSQGIKPLFVQRVQSLLFPCIP